MVTAPPMEQPLLCKAAIEAGVQLGLDFRRDVNDLPLGAQGGIGWFQQTRAGRKRASAVQSYLRPAMKRHNLHIVTNALVQRVLFDGRRATGVEYIRNGAAIRATATRGVVLATGAIGSPHLLQLSGVGSSTHLNRIGIPVVHDLPGVGRNMQDHVLTRGVCTVSGVETLNDRAHGLRFGKEFLKYITTGTGMLTYPAFLVAASVKALEESATPDVQIQFAPASIVATPTIWFDNKPGMTASAFPMRPLSRGYVEAQSNRPEDAPLINPRYLSEEPDQRAMIGGIRWLRRLFAAPALAKYVIAESLPGADIQTDDELLDYARRTGSTAFHASCTCRMGTDEMAVVDDRLRVRGIDRLRVIDASVMPTVTSTNTNAPTIMIAEKGAVMMQQEAKGSQG
jgi:choline dehydrogenase